MSISQIKTKTLDNVFSVDEVCELLDLISNEDIQNNDENIRQRKTLGDNSNGRSRVNLNHSLANYNVVPEHILNKIINLAKSEYGKDVKIHNIYSTTYSKKFGIPQLSPHRDNAGSVFIIDYRLDGNIDWPIIVEGEEFLLKNNQALMADVYNKLHWRDPKKFLEEDFLTMVYFLFYDPSNEIKDKTVEETQASYSQQDIDQIKLFNKMLGEVRKQYDEER